MLVAAFLHLLRIVLRLTDEEVDVLGLKETPPSHISLQQPRSNVHANEVVLVPIQILLDRGDAIRYGGQGEEKIDKQKLQDLMVLLHIVQSSSRRNAVVHQPLIQSGLMHEFLLNHAGVADDDDTIGNRSIENARNRILASTPSIQNEDIRSIDEC